MFEYEYELIELVIFKNICVLFKDIVNGFPKTCQEVQNSGGQEGHHILDPEQDDLDLISVFCNMSSSTVTAVLHHNLEQWSYVSGYDAPGSYHAQVSYVKNIWHANHTKKVIE